MALCSLWCTFMRFLVNLSALGTESTMEFHYIASIIFFHKWSPISYSDQTTSERCEQRLFYRKQSLREIAMFAFFLSLFKNPKHVEMHVCDMVWRHRSVCCRLFSQLAFWRKLNQWMALKAIETFPASVPFFPNATRWIEMVIVWTIDACFDYWMGEDLNKEWKQCRYKVIGAMWIEFNFNLVSSPSMLIAIMYIGWFLPRNLLFAVIAIVSAQVVC